MNSTAGSGNGIAKYIYFSLLYFYPTVHPYLTLPTFLFTTDNVRWVRLRDNTLLKPKR